MTARILMTGSRDWTDRDAVVRALSDATKNLTLPITLVHGAARGADSLAAAQWLKWHQQWPAEYAAPEGHPAAWREHGKRAGHLRNAHMVSLGADILVTFALPTSVGTFDCADKARAAGIPVVDCGVSTLIEHRPRRAAA